MATVLDLPPDGESRLIWPEKFRVAHRTVRDVADRAELNAPVSGSVPSDGVTNAGPAIQALYDAGIPFVAKSTGTYYINTPVFFDRADNYRSYTMYLNGAKIILGTGLPTTAAFFRDVTTTWAFFGNTLRSAWNTGTNVVVVDDNTRASGVNVGNLLSVVFNNGTVAGAGRNAGLLFNNRCGSRMERIILSGARTLVSWFDYSDCAVFDECHNRRDTAVTDSALLTQINNGDGVEFRSCKADGAMLLGHMSLCRGATITGNVTGRYIFVECSAIVVSGAHQETNIPTGGVYYPSFRVLGSRVTFINCVFYPPRDAAVGCIDIEDTAATKFSDVTLINCQEQLFFSSGSNPPPDDPWGPTVNYTDEQAGTELHVIGSFGTLVASGGTADGWNRSGPITVRSTGQASALTPISAQAQIATGSFTFGRYNAGSPSFRVRPLGHGVDMRATNVMGAITMTALAGGTKLTGGALTASTVYAYCAALYNHLGHSTANSAETTATTTASATIRLECNPPQAGVFRVWRKVAAGVVAGATHWADIPTRGGRMYLWDTGTRVNGVLWSTTSVPARPSTNNTVRSITIDGTVIV